MFETGRGQINKLDFLIQALVKTSRLESEKEMIEEQYHFYMGQAQMISYGAMLRKIYVILKRIKVKVCGYGRISDGRTDEK